jgi:hypothetical protein
VTILPKQRRVTVFPSSAQRTVLPKQRTECTTASTVPNYLTTQSRCDLPLLLKFPTRGLAHNCGRLPLSTRSHQLRHRKHTQASASPPAHKLQTLLSCKVSLISLRSTGCAPEALLYTTQLQPQPQLGSTKLTRKTVASTSSKRVASLFLYDSSETHSSSVTHSSSETHSAVLRTTAVLTPTVQF